jgi:1,4-dihydroxy-2-naphthoate octaprenyltransferase
MALYTGEPLNVAALFWGQVAITSIQWMTHYGNEYFDVAADQANLAPTRWAGGSRVLVSGRLHPQVALVAALTLAGIALVAAMVLALWVRPGPWTLPLLFAGLLLSWAYSAPPLQLHSRGLGELAIAVVVAGLTPLVGYYLQAGQLSWLPVLAVLPLCALQMAQSLAIELADLEGDAAAGKRTLVVRLGRPRAARLMIWAMALAYAMLPVLAWLGLPALVVGAILVPLPVAAWQAWRLARGAYADPRQWDSIALVGIGLVMGTAALELVAFVVAWL